MQLLQASQIVASKLGEEIEGVFLSKLSKQCVLLLRLAFILKTLTFAPKVVIFFSVLLVFQCTCNSVSRRLIQLYLQNVHVRVSYWTGGPDGVWNVPGSGVKDGMCMSSISCTVFV